MLPEVLSQHSPLLLQVWCPLCHGCKASPAARQSVNCDDQQQPLLVCYWLEGHSCNASSCLALGRAAVSLLEPAHQSWGVSLDSMWQ